MQPIDNSDLAWLIIADFLADQNKTSESEELRESVANPENENWDRQSITLDRVGSNGIDGVGASGRCGTAYQYATVSGVGGYGGSRVGCVGKVVDGVGESGDFGNGVGGSCGMNEDGTRRV